jgi:hypothetical protein
MQVISDGSILAVSCTSLYEWVLSIRERKLFVTIANVEISQLFGLTRKTEGAFTISNITLVRFGNRIRELIMDSSCLCP